MAAIPRAIRAAGFQPFAMHLRARGAFEPRGEFAQGEPDCFRIRGWSQCHPVRGERASPTTAELTIEADVDFTGRSAAVLVLRGADRGEPGP